MQITSYTNTAMRMREVSHTLVSQLLQWEQQYSQKRFRTGFTIDFQVNLADFWLSHNMVDSTLEKLHILGGTIRTRSQKSWTVYSREVMPTKGYAFQYAFGDLTLEVVLFVPLREDWGRLQVPSDSRSLSERPALLCTTNVLKFSPQLRSGIRYRDPAINQDFLPLGPGGMYYTKMLPFMRSEPMSTAWETTSGKLMHVVSDTMMNPFSSPLIAATEAPQVKPFDFISKHLRFAPE